MPSTSPPPSVDPASSSSPGDVAPELVAEAHRVLRQLVSTHAPERIGVSFNGGKDSMVTVHLLVAAVGEALVRRMVFFVFDSPDEFPELREFRDAEAARLGVKLVVVPGPSRDALWRLHRELGLEAAVVGMRRADPSGAWLKSNVTPCTAGWPPMTLYLPVLEWGVPEVWDYTRARAVPFCALYAQGYTSLGPRHETTPNPALEDPQRPGVFRPAWEMRDTALERASRGSSVLSTPTPHTARGGAVSPNSAVANAAAGPAAASDVEATTPLASSVDSTPGATPAVSSPASPDAPLPASSSRL